MEKEKKSPYIIQCEPGNHYWCVCGLSSNMPYCNGEHARQNTGKKPHLHVVGTPTTVYLCGCGKSLNTPYCDGSHNNEE